MNEFPLRGAGVAALALLVMAGCGAPPGNRQLESLSVSPATATANGSSVQFTATSYWSTSPTTVTPQSATWGACTSGVESPTSDVTVSTAGTATCSSGAKGTYVIFADVPVYPEPGGNCLAINACGGGCGLVSASAQLTCP
jgi:hypothetical protein